MRKQFLALVALLLILAVMVGWVIVPRTHIPSLNIHGYDSPVAQITEIDHSYSPRYVDVRESMLPNAAYVYPYALDIHDLITETGLRIEIRSAPNVLSKTFIETISVAEVDKVAKTNKTKNWDVHRVKCSMGATVKTYEGGVAKCGQTTFWITLSTNPNSIFSTTDDHYDFFVNVYNIDPAVIIGEMEVTPTATGDYVYTPIGTGSVPSWIRESGYTGEINSHKTIKFPLTVLNAQPTVIAEVVRTGEASAQFLIGFDVILFGYWEQVVDYREWREPPIPDLLGDLIVFFTLFAWVVLGFAATILIFRFVPDVKLKLLATAIVWVVLLAIYGINAITVWMGG
jgi:hypothetical protein